MDLTTVRRPLKTARATADLRRGRRDWYRIENATGDEAVIYIYDEIGFWGVTAADFVRELSAVSATRLTVRLNSPGGDVFDGIAIHTALRDHPAAVEVRVDSLAASIASVIAMAGDRVVMAKHSTFMIHDPFALAIGDAQDMRKMADVLDQLGDTIAGVYAERAGGSVREWRDRMLAETWYTDRETVDAGLADAVAGDEASTENSFDLSIFRNTPAHLRGPTTRREADPPTKRDIERALRDAGLSHAAAKAVIAGGWRDLPADGGARDVLDLAPLLAALKTLNERTDV